MMRTLGGGSTKADVIKRERERGFGEKLTWSEYQLFAEEVFLWVGVGPMDAS